MAWQAPKKNTIRYKIAVHSVRASLLLVLLTMVTLFGLSELYLTWRTERMQVAIAKQLRNDVDGWLETQSARLELLTSGVSYMVELGYTDRGAVKDYLKRCLEDDEFAFDYYMAFEDGEIIYASGAVVGEDYDPRTRSWYTDAVEKQGVSLSEMYIDYQTREYCITISKPVYDGNRLVGVVAEDLYIDDIVNLSKQADIDTMGYTIIVDKHGNILTHKNEEYTPKIADDGSAILTNYADAGIDESIIGHDGVNKQITFDGVYRSIYDKALEITVISAMDWRIYFRPVNIILSVSILLLIVAHFVQRDNLRRVLPPLLAPLGELEVVAEDMSMGFLNYKASYRVDDEIGNLCLAVETSNRVIKEYIDEVSEVLDNMGRGDFSRKIQKEYTGDFVPLKASVNNAIKSLSDITFELHGQVDALYQEVQGIKDGNEVNPASLDDKITQIYWIVDTLEYMTDEEEGVETDII